MKTKEFYNEFELLLELAPGSIKGDEALDSLAGWNSLAIVSFMAMADEKFNLLIPVTQLGQCKNIQDIIGLLGDNIID